MTEQQKTYLKYEVSEECVSFLFGLVKTVQINWTFVLTNYQ